MYFFAFEILSRSLFHLHFIRHLILLPQTIPSHSIETLVSHFASDFI